MRRALLILLFTIISLGAAAQSAKNVIEVDPASFIPVQSGTLTGVGIDAIGVDRSKRPCARIKLHINRMTPEEIAQIEVRLPGGMVELMRRDVAAEGNGLILELTAKPDTRLILHHHKYGDSNEVKISPEANKEFYLNAQLNLLLPITVASNVKGADVYLDGIFRGTTGEDYMCAIADVVPGSHKIKIQHGAASAEKGVDVNSESFSFRVDVNAESSRPQYAVFEVEPKHATVFVDNQPLTNVDGIAEQLLSNGTYTFRVVAKGYHEKSGTFTISGQKIKRTIKLDPDGAVVTITTDPASEIWINNKLKGKGSWSGLLLSDIYIFEARKTGYRTTTLSKQISSNPPTQSYELDAPTPIQGALNLTSVPSSADVKINGRPAGETPLLTDLLVGSHSVEVSKSGYIPWRKDVTINEGQTTSVAASLTKIASTTTTKPAATATTSTTTIKPTTTTPAYSSSATTVASVPNPALVTKGPYKVGDYYNDGRKEGVVFWVDFTGHKGKIISLTEPSATSRWEDLENNEYLGANSSFDGAKNMDKVKQVPNWQSAYPAFKACADLGEEWYLPATNELLIFSHNRDVHDAVNRTLAAKGGTLIPNVGEKYFYWSSTEFTEFEAYHIAMGDINNKIVHHKVKTFPFHIRAVAKFCDEHQRFGVGSKTSAPYKIGDYYNDGRKEGVVFWVDKTGKHGKIVNLAAGGYYGGWCVESEKDKAVGATDLHHGFNNTAKVKQIPDWQSKYPLFKALSKFGEEWYLPAVQELCLLTHTPGVLETVNRTLSYYGHPLETKTTVTYGLWTSTESAEKSKQAWALFESFSSNHEKESCHRQFRAVATFGDREVITAAFERPSGATYQVGDYYNDGKKEGVVFWVDDTGKHGKIVNLDTQSHPYDPWMGTTIGATDKHNGANNMARMKKVSGWKKRDSAFKWCAELGKGWYVPAIEELKMFTQNQAVLIAVNHTLSTKGKTIAGNHWSSTEEHIGAAWITDPRSDSPALEDKTRYNKIRAVAAF